MNRLSCKANVCTAGFTTSQFTLQILCRQTTRLPCMRKSIYYYYTDIGSIQWSDICCLLGGGVSHIARSRINILLVWLLFVLPPALKLALHLLPFCKAEKMVCCWTFPFAPATTIITLSLRCPKREIVLAINASFSSCKKSTSLKWAFVIVFALFCQQLKPKRSPEGGSKRRKRHIRDGKKLNAPSFSLSSVL